MRCDSCADMNRERNLGIENAVKKAKRIADEVKKPQAICEEEVNQSIFVVDAFAAYENRFKVLQVVSGFEDNA